MTFELYKIHENVSVIYGISTFKFLYLCQELTSTYSSSKQFLCSTSFETTYVFICDLLGFFWA